MLPPAERLVRAQLSRYIEQELFWVLHAPRQTGKTTFLMNWMRELNASKTVVACYVTVEICQGVPEPERSMPAIVGRAAASAEMQTGIRPAAPPPRGPSQTLGGTPDLGGAPRAFRPAGHRRRRLTSIAES